MIKVIIKDLFELQKSYAFEARWIPTLERYKILVQSGLIKDWDYDDEAVREPLIEHVGHLPIIATFLHQHIEHHEQVDLGMALTMLAIHDIGETELGDVFAYNKTKKDETNEVDAAKKLLPPYLFDVFIVYEERKTLDAKFAKSVDSIAPILHDLSLPSEEVKGRFKHYNFGVEKIINKKRSDFEWDRVLLEIFDSLIEMYPQYNY